MKTNFVIAILLCTVAVAQQSLKVPTAKEAGLPSTSPWVVAKPGIAHGRVEPTSLHSKILDRDKKIFIYTPPGFDRATAKPYDLLVAFDGAEYVDMVPVPIILDNLLAAAKIQPTVAILIDNGSGAERLGELANRAQFAKFLSDELIPWARKNWNVTADPQRTIVTGSSAGGLASAYIALRRPDLFGNVLAQSPAFWRGNEASNDPPYEWLTKQYAASPKVPVTFYVEMGGGETKQVLGGAGPVPIEASRRFRDALLAKGYTIEYTEIKDAQHEPGHWRNHLADGIIWLTSRSK